MTKLVEAKVCETIYEFAARLVAVAEIRKDVCRGYFNQFLLLAAPGVTADDVVRQWDLLQRQAALEAETLKKRPVAWRVKDHADGWILFSNEADAYKEHERTGAVMQGLYVRDGT